MKGILVDLIGIEPMTSSMPWKRAPSCATGPRFGGDNSLIFAAPARFVKRPAYDGLASARNFAIPATIISKPATNRRS